MTGMDRITVPEAAVRLGISENALRKRVQRNTIQWDRDEDGRVYVYLSPTCTGQADGIASNQAVGQASDQSLLIARLENEVEYLRREAEDWKEEARRKDTIIMTMAQRIPELEPASEPRESSESGLVEDGNNRTPPDSQEKSVDQPPWWRRWFS
jgi:hypothetical protein